MSAQKPLTPEQEKEGEEKIVRDICYLFGPMTPAQYDACPAERKMGWAIAILFEIHKFNEKKHGPDWDKAWRAHLRNVKRKITREREKLRRRK